MVENFVVSDDAFVGGLSFEAEDLVSKFLGIPRFEPHSFFRSEKHEKRSEKNG